LFLLTIVSQISTTPLLVKRLMV